MSPRRGPEHSEGVRRAVRRRSGRSGSAGGEASGAGAGRRASAAARGGRTPGELEPGHASASARGGRASGELARGRSSGGVRGGAQGGARGGRSSGGARGGARGGRSSGTRASRRPAPPARATAGDAPVADGGGGTLTLRLNKALSRAGLGSRRAVEELVRAGRVSVNGELVGDLGRRLDPATDRVEVDGSRVVLDERRRYWLLNKPAGVVTTAADPAGRPTVVALVPPVPRVFPVGRLDRETEGLLLLTNDGPLAYRLTHARYGVEKRYLAEVDALPPAALRRVREGVELADGPARAVRARVVGRSGRRQLVEVSMVEGRNREVRRLLDAVGAPVRRLVRTAIGPVRLTGLGPGEYRALRADEVRSLYRAVGL